MKDISNIAGSLKNKAQENNRIIRQTAQTETHKPATHNDLFKTLDNGEA